MNTTLLEKFEEFHADNPEIYNLFTKFTNQIIARGFKHYGAKSVMERIRWHSDVTTLDIHTNFKLSNNHTAYYSRLFEVDQPQYKGFFRKRGVLSDLI